MNAIDLILTATFTGIGVSLGQAVYIWAKEKYDKHKDKLKNMALKLKQ